MAEQTGRDALCSALKALRAQARGATYGEIFAGANALLLKRAEVDYRNRVAEARVKGKPPPLFSKPVTISSPKAISQWVNAPKLPPTEEQLLAVVEVMKRLSNSLSQVLSPQEIASWQGLYQAARNAPSQRSAEKQTSKPPTLAPTERRATHRRQVQPRTWALSATVLCLTVVLVIGVRVLVVSRNSVTSTVGAPFTWTADWQSSPGHLFRQTTAELGPSPSGADHIQWARERHGVFSLPVPTQTGSPAAQGGIALLLRSKVADVRVTLLALTLEVMERRPPMVGTRVYRPSGGAQMGRYIDFDVDADPPRIIDSSNNPEYNPTLRKEPMQFPYQISTTDTELFLVSVRTAESDITWRVRIAWSTGVDSSETVIDNDGSPFEVSAPGPGSQICAVLGTASGTPYTPETRSDGNPSIC
ncbi:hypothetical protein ACWIGW_39995 [Nocardia brasiliensis]